MEECRENCLFGKRLGGDLAGGHAGGVGFLRRGMSGNAVTQREAGIDGGMVGRWCKWGGMPRKSASKGRESARFVRVVGGKSLGKWMRRNVEGV